LLYTTTGLLHILQSRLIIMWVLRFSRRWRCRFGVLGCNAVWTCR
jgi:hypothetical protein